MKALKLTTKESSIPYFEYPKISGYKKGTSSIGRVLSIIATCAMFYYGYHLIDPSTAPLTLAEKITLSSQALLDLATSGLGLFLYMGGLGWSWLRNLIRLGGFAIGGAECLSSAAYYFSRFNPFLSGPIALLNQLISSATRIFLIMSGQSTQSHIAYNFLPKFLKLTWLDTVAARTLTGSIFAIPTAIFSIKWRSILSKGSILAGFIAGGFAGGLPFGLAASTTAANVSPALLIPIIPTGLIGAFLSHLFTKNYIIDVADAILPPKMIPVDEKGEEIIIDDFLRLNLSHLTKEKEGLVSSTETKVSPLLFHLDKELSSEAHPLSAPSEESDEANNSPSLQMAV